MTKRFMSLLILILLLSGCAGIQDQIYTSESSSKILTEVKQDSMPETDKKLFEDAIAENPQKWQGKKVSIIISEFKQQKELQVKAAEEERKKLKAGSIITTKSGEIKIKSVSLSYDVLPDDTSGFYTHYPATKGNVYIVLDVVVKNLQKQNLNSDEIMKVVADYNNGYKYNGFAVVKGGSGGFSYANITSIKPLETVGLKYLIETPEEVETSKNPLILNLDIDSLNYQYKIR